MTVDLKLSRSVVLLGELLCCLFGDCALHALGGPEWALTHLFTAAYVYVRLIQSKAPGCRQALKLSIAPLGSFDFPGTALQCKS